MFLKLFIIAQLINLNIKIIDATIYDDKIYILTNNDDNNLFIYEKNNPKYYQKYIRKGKGPGELIDPTSLTIINESLYISTNMGKIVEYSISEHNFLEVKNEFIIKSSSIKNISGFGENKILVTNKIFLYTHDIQDSLSIGYVIDANNQHIIRELKIETPDYFKNNRDLLKLPYLPIDINVDSNDTLSVFSITGLGNYYSMDNVNFKINKIKLKQKETVYNEVVKHNVYGWGYKTVSYSNDISLYNENLLIISGGKNFSTLTGLFQLSLKSKEYQQLNMIDTGKINMMYSPSISRSNLNEIYIFDKGLFSSGFIYKVENPMNK